MSLVAVRAAYKCRACPAPEQASVLNRTFGCVRVVWNRTLAWRHARYHGERVKTGFTQANAYLTAMKATDDLAWLTEASSVPLRQAIRRQQVACTNFFAERARYLRFKSRNGRQSAECTRSGFRYRDGALWLAKMDIARAHRKVRASRTDFLHRASTALVRDHDVIVIDDLAVQNMVRNQSLAKAICDCGWGAFRQMLEHKTAKAGRRLIVIDRWHPSSKTCSACSHLLAALSLKTRHWTCPSCRTRHDRDINAAKNILAAGRAVSAVGADACGADVSHSGSSRVRSAVNRNPSP
jgi:IS605 OrfB family transposase